MQFSLKRIPLLVFLFGLAGCATTIEPQTASSIRRIGVISIAATDFQRIYVGFMVFGNEGESKDIREWDVDRAYEDQMATALEAVTKATVVRAPYSKWEMVHLNDLNGPMDHPMFWDPNWDAVREANKKYCEENNLDAILFATRVRAGDFIGGTNQRVDGVGIYARSNVAKLYMSARITIFDCRAAKPLILRGFSATSGISKDLATKPIAEWTPEEADQIKNGLIALPGNNWMNGLKSMYGQKP
jgi:hypothetical protein